MKAYCPYCRKEVDYNIEKRSVSTFKGVKVDTFMNVAVCKSCNNDLYVNDLEKENMKRVYVCYSLNTDIIKPSDIIDFRNKLLIDMKMDIFPQKHKVITLKC